MEPLCPCFWGKRIQQDYLCYPSFFLLAIFQSFAIMRMKNKICGSFQGSDPLKVCAGERTTYTTAYGRTAWTILYSFSPGNARVFPCQTRAKRCILSYPVWCGLGWRTHRLLPWDVSCRDQNLHGIFVFPRPTSGGVCPPPGSWRENTLRRKMEWRQNARRVAHLWRIAVVDIVATKKRMRRIQRLRCLERENPLYSRISSSTIRYWEAKGWFRELAERARPLPCCFAFFWDGWEYTDFMSERLERGSSIF